MRQQRRSIDRSIEIRRRGKGMPPERVFSKLAHVCQLIAVSIVGCYLDRGPNSFTASVVEPKQWLT